MDTKFNQNLLWKKIFLYTNYRNLSKEHKVFVDILFADILSITSKENGSDYSDYTSQVYSLKKYDVNSLKTNDRYWLIDNNLGLVFTGVYGGHEFLRPPLTIMHFFVKGLLTYEQINKLNSEYNVFINNPSKRSQFSDIFTGMHLGIYESGAELDRETGEGNVIVADGYPFYSLGQETIKSQYRIDSIDYEKEEATLDFLNLIKEV